MIPRGTTRRSILFVFIALLSLLSTSSRALQFSARRSGGAPLFIDSLFRDSLQATNPQKNNPKTCWAAIAEQQETDTKTTKTTKTTTTTSTVTPPPSSSPLPPVIQEIANEQQEFNINLGKAMDVLRKDYPDMLTRAPDFSIYHDSISVEDPSGVQLTGLANYKGSFAFAQTMFRMLFVQELSRMQVRMVYDFTRSAIRVSWHVVLVPKMPMSGGPIHVDGISTYTLQARTGKITQHKIDNLTLVSTSVEPPYNVILNMLSLVASPARVPVGAGVVGGVPSF